MRLRTVLLAATLAATLPASAFAEMADAPAQVGPRPFYLTDLLPDGELKSKLESCAAGPFRRSAFSIGHRGAPLQFPEHTRESYVAGARMGAGILECDVAFTKDKQLVCRHSQCDLHTTTNILDTPLAEKCSVPFSPASFRDGTEASAKCCTSDITLDEFRTLTGKMDASNKHAMTPKSYLGGTAGFRTDLYSAPGGQLMTHAESIALFRELGTLFTPELKSPSVEMPFDGMSQEDYAQSMVDEYKAAGIDPADVWLQSFNLDDVLYWVKNEPEFGKQAVYLDGRYDNENFDPMNPETFDVSMADLKAQGVNVIAPPLWMLVTLDEAGKIVPSAYAKAAQDAELKMIAWTLERSGDLTDGGGWYFKSIAPAVTDGAAALELLDVLAQDVGVIGVFSDWPGTTTYYANCMGL